MSEPEPDFCLYCGAWIPPRDGEGTCPKCNPMPTLEIPAPGNKQVLETTCQIVELEPESLFDTVRVLDPDKMRGGL